MDEIEIEVFRADTRASRGITAENIAEVAAFDCATNPIPNVLGHPAGDKPALGAVKGFRADGGSLFARIPLVGKAQAIVDGIKDGSILNRSMAFFDPNHEANPTPGKWAPRHLGWLGGAAPGIPGMQPLSKALAFAADGTFETLGLPADAVVFAAEPTGVVTVFDGGEPFSMDAVAIPKDAHAKAKKSLRKAIDMHKATMNGSAPKSGAAGDKHKADMLAAMQDAHSCLTAKTKTFDATGDDEMPEFTAEQIAENDRLDAREKAIAARIKTQFEASNGSAIDGYVREGKVTPAEAEDLKIAFNALDPEGEELTFGAGDKTTKATAAGKLHAFIAGLPKRVPVGKQASPTGEFSADETLTSEQYQTLGEQLVKSGKALDFDAAIGMLDAGVRP